MPPARPVLVLLGAHGAHQAQHGLDAREDLDHPRPVLYLPVHALLHVVGAYAPPVLRGEVQVGEDVGLGLLEERADIAPTASMAARYTDLTVAC